MAHEGTSQFAPSWFSTLEAGSGSRGQVHRVRAYVRLWRAFMRARVVIALVLLALQVFVLLTQSGGPQWLVLVNALHLSAALAVLLWTRPIEPGKPFGIQWLMSIGVDLAVFAVLQYFQQSGINYTPLFALPVLLASILGSMTLALATAAGVTLYLLGDAALAKHHDPVCLAHGGKAVADKKNGLAPCAFFQGVEELFLGIRVHEAGGFVENQEGGFADEGAGNF